jgi:hypothetical protein
MSDAKLYFDFLNRCERKASSINQLSAHISTKLLVLFFEIAKKQSANQNLTISEAMSMRSFGSSAALHARICDLREAGMIRVIFKASNRRTKYLVVSEKGNQFLNLMGSLLKADFLS